MYKFKINSKTIFNTRLKTELASISISMHLKIFSQESFIRKIFWKRNFCLIYTVIAKAHVCKFNKAKDCLEHERCILN